MTVDKKGQGRRSAHRTQWAAQFAVVSELCKRGYEVAFTMGNHPKVDLMVISPHGNKFSIDVKGLYRPNFWVVRPQEPVGKDIYYVLAYVPDNKSNSFFVLTHEQVDSEIEREIERIRASGRSADRRTPMLGHSWSRANSFRDRWDVLPR